MTTHDTFRRRRQQLQCRYGRGVRNKGRLRAMLSLAKFAGYTFMRVWGGGLIEDAYFYDLADEFGILLQQRRSRLRLVSLSHCQG